MWTHHKHCQSEAAGPSGLGLGAPLCFGLGAASMYFFDPERGKRRRALVRDKLIRSFHDAGDCIAKTAEYSWNRAYGMLAEARGRLSHDDANDYVIRERVRAALGRAVSHPSAVEVDCTDGGVITLRGAVLASELDSLLSAVGRVRGVRDVRNEIEVHERPGREPRLQGGRTRTADRWEFLEDNWDPFARLVATVGGTALASWGLARRGVIGTAAFAAGATFAARGMTNLPVKRLTGAGAGRRAVDVQKTITIDAPVDQVFGFFASYQNFPHFMRNVREVRESGGATGRSHWSVAGPMGINLSWDADLTGYVPNELIAWRSVEGAAVENAGVIRFQERADGGGTRVDIKLAYNPPAGAIGHFLARLFGADPKSEMDQDLMRVKTALETGHPAHDAAQPAKSLRLAGM